MPDKPNIVTQASADFDYSNLPIRPGGRYLRLGATFLKGVKKVQRQIVPYAEAWQEHNRRSIGGQEPLWVVLGDSMSQGVGASAHDRGWVGQLDSLLKAEGRHYRILNLSMSGARISDVLERQLPVLQALEVQPDLVTVMVGSNDLVRKKFRLQALAYFEQLLAQIPEGSVVANLLGNRSIPVLMDTRLQQAVRERHLVLADIRQNGPKTWRGLVAEDHFHPNEAGYTVIADVFATALGISVTANS